MKEIDIQYQHGNALEPGAAAFINALAAKGGPEINDVSVTDARAVLVAAQANL